jgi:hypothetical protein
MPIVAGGLLIGQCCWCMSPAPSLQRRVLSAGLNEGLLRTAVKTIESDLVLPSTYFNSNAPIQDDNVLTASSMASRSFRPERAGTWNE